MKHFTARAALLLVAGLLFSSAARGAECDWNVQPLGGIPGAPEVNTGTCVLNGGALTVRKLRLNEPLAAAIVLNELSAELKLYFGTYRLVENDVTKTTRQLFQRFGRREVYAAKDISFSLNVSRDPTQKSAWRSLNIKPTGTGGDHVITQISPVFERADEENQIYPPFSVSSCSMYYSCLNDAFACTELWREIRPNELATVQKETERLLARFAKQNGDTRPDFSKLSKKFDYLRMLGKDGFPKDFLIMSGTLITRCDGAGDAKYLQVRPLALEVISLENKSRDRLVLKNFVGRLDRATKLREPGARTQQQPIEVGTIELQPGETALLAMRQVHLAPPVLDDMLELTEVSSDMYARISGKPANTVFSFGLRKAALKTMRKTEFKSPAFPIVQEYVYGPEIDVMGFEVEAPTSVKAPAAGDFVALLSEFQNEQQAYAVHKESRAEVRAEMRKNAPPVLGLWNPQVAEASCPILHVWSDYGGNWVRHGKVLHVAQGAEKEAVERISVPVDARAFSLSEDEPELAVIRDAALELTLRDGRQMRFRPSAQTDWPMLVPGMTRRELAFTVPQDVAAIGIDRSELVIRGFYIPYEALRQSEVDGRWRERSLLKN